MTRKLRSHSPGVPIHITSRGVGGRAVFLSDRARQRFLSDLLVIRAALPFFIHAYCLMTNHIHLLLEAIDQPLWKVMKKLLGQHATRVNTDLERMGHVFQGRYADTPCLTDSHYRNAIAYIANNPVRAGLVAHAEDWAWSSAREMTESAPNIFVERAKVLEAFDGLSDYRSLLENLPQAEAVRISNEMIGQKFDHDLFVELSGIDLRSFLDSLAQEAAAATGLTIQDIIADIRTRRESLARNLFIERARAAGVPIKEIARYLGRTKGAISKRKGKLGV